MKQIIAIIVLVVLLVLSVRVNVQQRTAAREAATQHKAELVTLQRAADAQATARALVEADRDQCLERLTTQEESAASIQRRAAQINADLHADMARLREQLKAERDSPQCAAWAAEPSCGVGRWP